MSVRVARIIAGLSVFALVTRMLALVSRLVTVRATPPKEPALGGVSGTPPGDALTPVPSADGASEPTSAPSALRERSNARALAAGLVVGRVKPPAQPPVAEDPEPEVKETTQPAPAAPTPVAPPSPRPAMVGAIGLLALIAITVVATSTAIEPLREILVLVAMLSVPGGTVMLRAGHGRDVITTLSVTIVLSLAVDVCVGLVMAWTGFWHPTFAAAVIALACAVSIAVGIPGPLLAASRQRPRGAGRIDLLKLRRGQVFRTLLAAAPIAVALGLWSMSLRTSALSHLTSLGVPSGLPATFYLALAIALAGTIAVIVAERPKGWLIMAYIGALVIIMFASLPAIASEPPYSYLYKHVGVVQLIEQTGLIHPSVDIYNRWPGFFAAAAAFAKLSGFSNPLHFAAWAQPLFAALDTLLVVACARFFSKDVRVAGWTALVYTVTNYTNESYFSPQAMAFVLSLGVLLLVLHQLTGLDGLHPRVASLAGRIPVGRMPATRGREKREASVQGPLQRRWVLPTVLLLHAAVIFTHQLSPYLVIFQVGALTALGLVRRRGLVVAMSAMAIMYLVPNFEWVRTHYGIFTSFDPLSNGSIAVAGHGPWLAQHSVGLLGWILSGLALIAAARLVRLGHARAVLALAALAAAPYAILASQSYGGEAPLRVALFSSPWRVILVAWALSTVSGRARQLAVSLPIVGILGALWLPSFFGSTPVSVIPRSEVRASEYFYEHAPAGSELVGAAPEFPLAVGARYAVMGGLFGRTITDDSALVGRLLGPRRVPQVISLMQAYPPSRSQYLVFSPTEMRYAAGEGQLSLQSMASLQRAVASSPRFRLWYVDGPTRIFMLLSPGSSQRGSVR
jgi:hypothetical protein